MSDVPFWQTRSVLVTGASGLVGSHLVSELLKSGAEVTVLLRDHDRRSELYRAGAIQRVAVVDGDLKNIDDVARAVAESECSIVFHLGAQTIVSVGLSSPLLTFEANVRGTYNVLEACRRLGRGVEGLIIASTDKAYGPSERPYREEDPLRADAPYDASKSAAELIAHSYFATYSLPIAVLRCGNTYGGGDLNWSRIVPGTTRSYLRGESPIIRSDGTFVRDYIYVSDVVAAYMRVGESIQRADVRGEAFNFASGAQVSVLEIVRQIRDLVGGELPEPRILNVVKNEIKEQRLVTDKARRVLGWEPRVSLSEGLRRTIEWYRSYMESFA